MTVRRGLGSGAFVRVHVDVHDVVAAPVQIQNRVIVWTGHGWCGIFGQKAENE